MNVAESIEVLERLKTEGLDLVDVGIGFSTMSPVTWAPNLLVPVAERIRRETDLQVATSWLITDAKEADGFVRNGQLDLVMFARRLLDNPHWPQQAARQLGVTKPSWVLPTPYAYWLENWAAA